MRDAVLLNKEGVCVVVVSKEMFLDLTQFDAKIMGLPNLPICCIPEAIRPEEWRDAAEKVVDELIAKLTSPETGT